MTQNRTQVSLASGADLLTGDAWDSLTGQHLMRYQPKR